MSILAAAIVGGFTAWLVDFKRMYEDKYGAEWDNEVLSEPQSMVQWALGYGEEPSLYYNEAESEVIRGERRGKVVSTIGSDPRLRKLTKDIDITPEAAMLRREISAEQFAVEFDDWAEQEMKTHGYNISFREWADEESQSHGDEELLDWAQHEEESHEARYDAEEREPFDIYRKRFYTPEVKRRYQYAYKNYVDNNPLSPKVFGPPITFEQFADQRLKQDYRARSLKREVVKGRKHEEGWNAESLSFDYTPMAKCDICGGHEQVGYVDDDLSLKVCEHCDVDGADYDPKLWGAESFGAEDDYVCPCGSHELRYVEYSDSDHDGFFCMSCGLSPCGIRDTDDKPCTCDLDEFLNRSKSYDAESYKPPASAVANAKRGLELRKEFGRGGLSPSEAKSHGIDSGVTRARKIASGKVSRHDVRRMSAFNRHRKNNNPSKKMPDGGPTAGTIAWLLWGGTSGVNWAKNKSATMNAETMVKQVCLFCENDDSEEELVEIMLDGYPEMICESCMDPNNWAAESFEAPKICLECNKEWEYDSRDKSHSNFCHDCSPRPETFDAESFGPVDEDGILAKALAKARAKSREPRQPLKITKLPHRDQKSLKDFEEFNSTIVYDKPKGVIAQVMAKEKALQQVALSEALLELEQYIRLGMITEEEAFRKIVQMSR